MKKIMIICLPILLFCSILSAQGSGNSIEHTYINCGSNSSLSLLGSFTIEAWIYPLENDIIGEHSIIDRRYGDGGYQLRLGGSVSFRLRAIGGAEYAISASGLVANKWQHIAGVYRYDSESGNHYHKIYINGVLKAGPTNLGTFTRGNNDTEFYIGRSKLVSTFLLNGEIDEVRAWS